MNTCSTWLCVLQSTCSKSLCTNPDERQVDPLAKFCTSYSYIGREKLHVMCSINSMLILSNVHYHYPKESAKRQENPTYSP